MSLAVLSLLQELIPVFTKKTVTETTPLFGRDGVLDSIQFVSFLVQIENEVQVRFGKEIRLISDSAFSQKNSPFLNLQSLSEWISKQIGQ